MLPREIIEAVGMSIGQRGRAVILLAVLIAALALALADAPTTRPTTPMPTASRSR
jgi:hypothetical protein